MYIEVIYTEYFSENLVFSVYYKSPRGPFIFYSSKIIFSWTVFFLFCFHRISIEISRNLKLCAISVLLNVFHSSTPFVSVLSPKCSLKCRLRCFHSLNHPVVSPHCFGGIFIAGPCWPRWPLLPRLCGPVDHEQLLLLCAASLGSVPSAFAWKALLCTPIINRNNSHLFKVWLRHSISCGPCLGNLL